MTLLLVGGLIADRQRTALAVICGTGFFALFGGFVILVLSGQLTRMHDTRQRERTVRERDRMSYSLYTAPQLAVEGGEMGHNGGESIMPLSPPTSYPTFVPSVPTGREGVKIAAYDFIYSLFEGGENGLPDPQRVLGAGTRSPDRIQLRKPRPEVLEYLMGLEVVRVGEGKALFYNSRKYPTLVEAKRAIKLGRKV